jgi:hypothetical protein
MSKDGNRLLETIAEASEVRSFVPKQPERLMLENSSCWATKDEEQEAIHIFAQDGSELYAVSAKVIPYESKPLYLTLQIYLMGYNSGRNAAQQEVKNKLEKFADLIKLCV